MAENVLTRIQGDHEEIRRLVDDVRGAGFQRQTRLEQLAAWLTAHLRAERATVHPALSKASGSGEVSVEDVRTQELERQLRVLLSTPPDASDFDVALDRLGTAVTDHARHQERLVLTKLRALLGEDELNRMGDVYASRFARELYEAPQVIAAEQTTIPALGDWARQGATGESRFDSPTGGPPYAMSEQQVREALERGVD